MKLDFFLIEERTEEVKQINKLFPSQIPIIIQRLPTSQVSNVLKPKLIIPNNTSFRQFRWIFKQVYTTFLFL